MIAWTDFTWDAFATLVTGLAAVIAAWRIGAKQTEIANRQVKINERQAEIADQQRKIISRQVEVDAFRLKSELFDLRYSVYQSTKALISKIMTTGYPLEAGIEANFLDSLDQSRFLFRPSVYEDLNEIWGKHCSREANKKIMQQNFQTSGDYGKELIEMDYRSSLWFDEKLRNLSALFGDELKLSLDTA